jgi:hypothetical protein
MNWPWIKKKRKDPILNYTLGDLQDCIQYTLDCISKVHLGHDKKWIVELCKNIPYRYEFIIHRGVIVAYVSIADILYWLGGPPQHLYGHIEDLVNTGERSIARLRHPRQQSDTTRQREEQDANDETT